MLYNYNISSCLGSSPLVNKLLFSESRLRCDLGHFGPNSLPFVPVSLHWFWIPMAHVVTSKSTPAPHTGACRSHARFHATNNFTILLVHAAVFSLFQDTQKWVLPHSSQITLSSLLLENADPSEYLQLLLLGAQTQRTKTVNGLSYAGTELL